ncbi:ATP-binding protein [Myxosarcina sp. GI1]|uniref:ATP-binding protein n=1 Tax=Myxosarcina sp. GI1 TaxID=1541065 RepID=UPI00055A2D07|nr:ATP-binding protein [Myxosarcina sp. GI1]
MNSVKSPESLYQLTQDLETPLTSIAIGAETLKFYVEAIIELAIEQQLQATIWVKLPQTQTWLELIQKYYQTGKAKRIYLCNTQKKSFRPLADDAANKKVVPVKFIKNSWLQRESFLIVLSSQFSIALLSQWQKGQIVVESSQKRLTQPYIQMVSSFNSSVIEQILAGVKQIANAADTNNFIVAADLQVPQIVDRESTLLAQLLLKQIERCELLRTQSHRTSERQQSTNSAISGLQEEFLNSLARELRSPITHMKTALSLLESKQIKGEQRQRYLQMIGSECDRQNSLVRGLLELLQLGTPTENRQLNLDEFVPGIVSTYQPLAREQNIQLGYTIPASLPPIACPVAWLRQIIINLLNNSLQFTPAGGKVYVQASLKNEYIELSIADTGIGIEAKEIDKVFDSFYSTKAINQQQTTGAGLGLTIVRQLVERIGGSIEVNSRVGRGTNFKILLPTIPAELV